MERFIEACGQCAKGIDPLAVGTVRVLSEHGVFCSMACADAFERAVRDEYLVELERRGLIFGPSSPPCLNCGQDFQAHAGGQCPKDSTHGAAWVKR